MTTSMVSSKGQVIIPVELRKRFNINKGICVDIMEGAGRVIVIKPIPDDPIEASRGLLKGKTSLIKALLKERGNNSKS